MASATNNASASLDVTMSDATSNAVDMEQQPTPVPSDVAPAQDTALPADAQTDHESDSHDAADRGGRAVIIAFDNDIADTDTDSDEHDDSAFDTSPSLVAETAAVEAVPVLINTAPRSDDVSESVAASATSSTADITTLVDAIEEATSSADAIDISASVDVPAGTTNNASMDVVAATATRAVEVDDKSNESDASDADAASIESGEVSSEHDVDMDDAPAPNEREAYDPSNPSLSYERHNSDEYDPANPSGDYSNAYDPAHPSYDAEVLAYDPATPSFDLSHAVYDPEHPAYDQHETTAGATGALKRDALQLPLSPTKRQRVTGGDDDDADDTKGLAPAAFDRLKDLETLGATSFALDQVSRAAFASLRALPEFAQVAIIARFARVPLANTRDKNGQLMRLHREYVKENPHVAAFERVGAHAQNDPTLFEFGYAPPLPATGMSLAPVPYQKDVVAVAAAPAKTAAVKPTTTAAAASDVDEFGRTIAKKTAGSSSSSNVVQPAPAVAAGGTLPAAAPSVSQLDSAAAVAAMASKPLDPRRRAACDDAMSEPVVAAAAVAGDNSNSVQDSRRPTTSATAAANGSSTNNDTHATTTQAPAAAPTQTQPIDPRRRVPTPSATAASASSTALYAQLPSDVRAVLDAMVAEGQLLLERMDDSVVQRLLQVPAAVALKAVENFSNVDLSLIPNLQAFLLGIINRVNDKANKAAQAQAQAPPQSS